MRKSYWSAAGCLSLLLLGVAANVACATGGETSRLSGLLAPARVVRDAEDIPHISAVNDHDAYFLMGYLHAQDRLFQMDLTRRQASGTSAELLGASALPWDIQARTLGFRRAAEASIHTLSPDTLAVLQAYADGVNAWIRGSAFKLPPEYAALNLTRASIALWTVVDTEAVSKLLIGSFPPDEDALASTSLAAFQAAGAAQGFDGTALYFDDVYRSAPFESGPTIPGFLTAENVRTASTSLRGAGRLVRPETLRLARRWSDSLREMPQNSFLQHSADAGRYALGSNVWIVSGRLSTSGFALLASDPHQGVAAPAHAYEAYISVENDPKHGPMRVYGVTYAGIPTVALGCNDRVCWGATFAPVDQTDNYQEEVIFDATTQMPTATLFDGKPDPITLIPQRFRVNQLTPGRNDNVTAETVPPLAGGVTVITHRHGPIVTLDTTNMLSPSAGISVQSVTLYPSRELEGSVAMARVRTVREFERAAHLVSFSYNYGVADVEGHIGYFMSGIAPLREDLQTLGRVDGNPPFMLRDGTHRLRNEWLPLSRPQPDQSLPYEILPYAEMPHAIDPPQGFLANTNNDPVGVTFENNPLGHLRPHGGIYYLDRSYADGNRQGQILRLIRHTLGNRGMISVADMMRMQANSQLFDASVLVPHILAAFDRAGTSASAQLATLAQDPRVAEAVARLRQWDFTTPTGIAQGYDAHSYPYQPGKPTATDASSSVAATLYSTWRGQFIQNTVDAALARAGIPTTGSTKTASAHGQSSLLDPLPAVRHLLDTFPQTRGLGSSGLNFFLIPGAPSAEAARDILILGSLRSALDLLGSDGFAPAFAHSTNQQDYRWGRLHREILAHPLGGPFDIPAAGVTANSPFVNLSAALPGLAKAGGFETLDQGAPVSIRPQGANDFMFSGGPSRRLVAELRPGGIQAAEIIPGGESADPADSFYSNMLGRYLTNDYHALRQDPEDVIAVQDYTP